MSEVKRRLDWLNQRDAARNLVGDEATQLLGRRDDGGFVAATLTTRRSSLPGLNLLF
jgi:hypothetical protein